MPFGKLHRYSDFIHESRIMWLDIKIKNNLMLIEHHTKEAEKASKKALISGVIALSLFVVAIIMKHFGY